MLTVSVIVPCYNEQATIRLLLEAVYAQTYPHQQIEMVIADSVSNDCTREEIMAFAQAHPNFQIKVLENRKRTIPSALNQALAAAQGEVIVRLDAHSVPYQDYIERCVAALESGKGENVGGVWDIQPGGAGWVARSIAAAAAHPLGVGDAHYRFTDQARYVDTLPFGSYRKMLVELVGLYDETLLANEDYEFNVRVRQSGGRVWLDPAIRSTYFARSSLSSLARQYWRYGFWKVRMLKRYLETIRWRQAVPPLFVLSLLVLVLLAVVFHLARWLLLAEIGVYAFVLLLTGILLAIRKRDMSLILGVPLAIATMHLSWGSAFLYSLLNHES
jgi:succinoglycan biosynthesis protein ExoA